jgi:uncharacterized protein (UPF0332 family)
VSPRSEELLASAREWLATAEAALESGFPGGAAAEAYYAMLYAARAALSERDRHARTHGGIWGLFGELFVRTGGFDRRLYAAARTAEERRLDVHYEAVAISEVEGREAVGDARRFIEAVAELVDAL